MSVFKPVALCCLVLSMCLSFTPSLYADDMPPARNALKVCADPQYMPFSSQEGKGYENRLAQLVAAELKLPLE